MSTGKVALLETRKPPAARVIYALLVLAVLCMAGVSFYLHLFDLTYYRFSFFDPTIVWLGCLVSLIAIFPLAARLKISRRARIYIAAACILVLGLGQLAVFLHAPFADFVPGDFFINFQASQELYAKLSSPYSITGSISFPFPTYFIYWLSSLGGSLSMNRSFVSFLVLNLLAWFIAAIVLWKHFQFGRIDAYGRSLLVLFLLNSSAFDAITGNGQTTVFVMLALVVMLVAFSKESSKWFLAGGACAGIAVLIKPQAALILLGLLVILCYNLWHRRSCKPLLVSIAGAVGVIVLLISVSLWFPAGLRVEFYGEFFGKVLPTLNDPAQSGVQTSFEIIRGNASPVALMVWLVSSLLGANVRGLSIVITILAVGFFIVAVIKTARLPLSIAMLPWLFAPLLVTNLTWAYSGAWILPACLFMISRFLQREKNAAAVIICFTSYAFMRVGVNILFLVSVGTLLVLFLRYFVDAQASEKFLPVVTGRADEVPQVA